MTTTIALVLLLAAQTEAPAPEPAPTETPTETTTELPTPPTLTPLQQAELLIDQGKAMEATALLLREERAGAVVDRAKAAVLLARAADVLADDGDVKAAAIAADAGWRLEDRPVRPRVSLLLVRYATVLRDHDAAGARALAERALVADPDNAAAKAMLDGLDGVDGWATGHLTVGGGIGLAILSTSAFVYGFDVERQARSGGHSRAEVDNMLVERGVAAAVAWPSAVASVVVSGLGLALIIGHEEPVPSTLPPSFPPLPSSSSSPASPALGAAK